MNKVILTGRLTHEPEVRYTQNGHAVANFTLAVDRYIGKEEHQTDFISVVAWNKLAEACGNNLVKGQKALVEGSLQIRSYETSDGQKRKVAEVLTQHIEFLSKPKAKGTQQETTQPAEHAQDLSSASSFGEEVFPDEDIPF